jgi:hypothetical protein
MMQHHGTWRRVSRQGLPPNRTERDDGVVTLAGITIALDGTIGAIAGALSLPLIFWGWAHLTGCLPEPAREGVEPEEIEVHGGPAV